MHDKGADGHCGTAGAATTTGTPCAPADVLVADLAPQPPYGDRAAVVLCLKAQHTTRGVAADKPPPRYYGTAERPETQRKAATFAARKAASLNFLCPTKLHLCPQTCTLRPLFQSLPRPPHSLPRPPNSLPSPLRSQGLLQLRGSLAVETRRFRWKEIDVFFTIAVSLLPRRTQPMADNYRGRQSRTGGGTIYFTRPFQVPDTGTARWQHGPAARQSRVRFPATD